MVGDRLLFSTCLRCLRCESRVAITIVFGTSTRSSIRFAMPHTNVAALDGSLGGTETKTNILVPSAAGLARSGALGLDLGVLEDVRLLLESALGLDGQLGSPVKY